MLVPIPLLPWGMGVPVLMALTGQPESEDNEARMVFQGQEKLVFKVMATREAKTLLGANSP